MTLFDEVKEVKDGDEADDDDDDDDDDDGGRPSRRGSRDHRAKQLLLIASICDAGEEDDLRSCIGCFQRAHRNDDRDATLQCMEDYLPAQFTDECAELIPEEADATKEEKK